MVFGQHGITGQLVVKAVILAPVPVVEIAHIQMVCHMGALVLEPTMKQSFAMLIYVQVFFGFCLTIKVAPQECVIRNGQP